MDEYCLQRNIRLSTQEINRDGFLSSIVQRVEDGLEKLNRTFFCHSQEKNTTKRTPRSFVFLKFILLFLCCLIGVGFIVSLPHKTPSRSRSATRVQFRSPPKVLYKSALDNEKKKKYARKYQQEILIALDHGLNQVKTYCIVDNHN